MVGRNRTKATSSGLSKGERSKVRAGIRQAITDISNRQKMVSGRPINKPPRRDTDNQATQSAFGPVSTIDTAPVSIGNTVRGSSPIVIPTNDGVRIKGRDFLLTVDVINNATSSWTLAGGAPITPSCMTTSVLKHYSNTYAEYKVHAVAFHYITSSTTATPGSIMLYVGKDRAGPGVITSSAALLPFVLSDQTTVITPVWQNASSVYHPAPKWFSTGLGNDEGLEEQSCGELFVLDKANSANTPGYILMDYDISFRVLQVNVKSMTFPVTRMKYTQMSFGKSGSVTANTTSVQLNVSGVLLDAATTSIPPSGYQTGDVYKCILNLTNSTLGGFNASTLLSVGLGDTNFLALTIADGFTCFGVIQTAAVWKFFPTREDAITGTNPLLFGATASTTIQLYFYCSLVGTVGSSLLQASY